MPANASTLQPEPQPLGADRRFVAAPASIAASMAYPQADTIPILLLMAADLYRNLLLLANVDPVKALITSFVCWSIAWLLISIRSSVRRFAKINYSPADVIAILFVITLIGCNFIVSVYGFRGDTSKMLQQAAVLAFMWCCYFAASNASRYNLVGRAMVSLAHAIALICVASIVSGRLGIGPQFASGRYFGFLGDPVAWAVSLPIVIYFAARRFFLLVICGAALALTASRGPALCVAAAVVLLLFFGRGHRLRYFLALCLAGIVLASQVSLFGNLLDRLGATQFTANDRLATARLGLNIFMRSPIFGMGYGAQGYLYPLTARRTILGEWSVQTSTFVQMLSEGGVLLFAVYFAFVIACTVGGIAVMKQASQSPHSRILNGVVAWLLAMLWVNQSAAWFLVGSYIGPLVLGMAGIVSGEWARIRAWNRQARLAPQLR